MKTIAVILVSFVFSVQLYAQEQTLISGPIESGGYGGLLMEYIGNPNKLVHYSISALIGAGGVGYRDPNDNYWMDSFPNDHTSAFFVLEPSAGAELNVSEFFSLNAGVSYRLVRGSDLPYISDDDLSNFSVYLMFKFGKF